MFFSFYNAFNFFQNYINDIFYKYLNIYYNIYINNIFIYSNNLKDY